MRVFSIIARFSYTSMLGRLERRSIVHQCQPHDYCKLASNVGGADYDMKLSSKLKTQHLPHRAELSIHCVPKRTRRLVRRPLHFIKDI